MDVWLGLPKLTGVISGKGVHMSGLELFVVKQLKSRGVFVCLKPNIPELITPSLTSEIRRFQNSLAEKYYVSPWEDNFYIVWYSQRGHGVCERGIDYNYIFNAIKAHQEVAFELYIRELFDVLFLNYVGLGLPIVNCSIIDRDITGLSQEFFFLNRVNFIKGYSPDILATKITVVNFQDVSTNLIFPNSVYQQNHFYKFSYYDIQSMRHLIEETDGIIVDERELEKIKRVFDEIKNNTINQIYQLASNDMHLLQRMAKMQTAGV